MPDLDETHDAARTSWVAAAAGHPDFPLQNLPLGIFSAPGLTPRAGTAIGDSILDLSGLAAAGLLSGEAGAAASALAEPTLNALLSLGAAPCRALRRRLFALLSAGAPEQPRIEPLLHDAARCTLLKPARIGAFTDFFAGIHHAVNAGKSFRPDNPLLPNYKHVPIAYHARASSIVASGAEVRRPCGQRKPPGEETPSFGPTRNLDFELELGIWIGPGNELGTPIPIARAREHIAGYCLLNDWSARDIQGWEYQPLGPFLAKNFATTISPWIVTPEALAPFRIAQDPRPAGDPQPLPYLVAGTDQSEGALDLALEVALMTKALAAQGRPAFTLAVSNTRHLYWTPAQMVAHHTCGGCNLEAGDLFGSGTISAPDATGLGALLEITKGGREPITLPSGETRTFLEDGDEITFTARAARSGFATIGFGPCTGRIAPARA
ncbi:MAG: fumarylacetoacetase [Hyphomicrobiaceae bacterium]|nr:fumarylacetoacetase [Hyphomicrobiaceae bacterium]